MVVDRYRCAIEYDAAVQREAWYQSQLQLMLSAVDDRWDEDARSVGPWRIL